MKNDDLGIHMRCSGEQGRREKRGVSSRLSSCLIIGLPVAVPQDLSCCGGVGGPVAWSHLLLDSGTTFPFCVPPGLGAG